MSHAPRGPRWAGWLLRRMMTAESLRAVFDELEELHAHRCAAEGHRAADRWYVRQLRQYPLRLAAVRLKRGVRPTASLQTAVRNVRQSARALSRVPALTVIIILTVGLSIGGSTTIFAVVDALLLRPLPYPGSERLFRIYTDSPPHRFPFSVVDYQALAEQQTSFEAIGTYGFNPVTFATAEVAERLLAAYVTPDLFGVLGLAPVAGRLFTAEDAADEAEATVVVTEGFASRYLGGPGGRLEEAAGAVINLDGTPHRVVGVLPANFGPLLHQAEVFAVLRMETPTRKGPFFLTPIVRLSEGVEAAAAAEELRAINRALFPLWEESYQDDQATWGMIRLSDALTENVGSMLALLSGVVGFVLLIASVNAANLLLARVGGRDTELAIRAAIGASRGQLRAFLLTESALLALGGVAVGLLATKLFIGLLPVVASSYLPRLDEVGLSGTVLAFAGLLALGSGLLFGLIPSIHGARRELAGDLHSGGRSSTQGLRQQRYQRALVAVQLAVVVPLLAGAGLLTSSFYRLQSVDPGFDAQGLLSARLTLSRGVYPEVETRGQFWSETLERVASLPGVLSVGLGTGRPPDQYGFTNNFDLEDKPTPPGQSQPSVPWLTASPGYFETMGIPLLAGRLLTDADQDSELPVVLVDKAWADRFFPGEEAVGRRFVDGGCTTCPWTTVVGVVGNVKYTGMEQAGRGVVYRPNWKRQFSPFLFVRVAGDPVSLIPAIREELRQIDPSVPLTAIGTADTLIESSLAQPRHLMWLLAGFSGLALLLSVIGLYGIMAYSVQRRGRDIAIRLALGGTPGAVLRPIVGQGMFLVVVSLGAGMVLALGVTRVLANLLFEVSPTDPATLVGVALLLTCVALVACFVPARRIVRTDPTTVLRQE